MKGPFHAGEQELQRRAGVREDAEAVGRIIRPVVPPGSERFLARQPFAVTSTLQGGGRVWASLLAGPRGFIQVLDERMLRLLAAPMPGDPLSANLAARPELGLLVVDLATRQRLRFNGRGLLNDDGVFLLVDQAYGNCPKYIHPRTLEVEPRSASGGTHVGDRLRPSQQDWIRNADTFFIASFHPEGGADASHRGGPPGFVRVRGARRLEFDDYPGNNMFNTLGNVSRHPPASLLFVDFEAGHVLQLAGQGRVGPRFTLSFEVEAVRETMQGSPLRSRTGPSGISTPEPPR